MKARKIPAISRRTETIFTDREEPRRAFWTVYDRVHSEPGSVEAISYYGVGGIGKSSLLFQLMRELKERAPDSPEVYYSFELSGGNKDDCLYFLAESLMQQCSGLQFPLFGAALLRLNQKDGIHNKLHSTLCTVVRRFMSGEERSRLDNAVFRLLIERMESQDFQAEREDYAAWAAELLAREDSGVNAAEHQLRAIFLAADACNDLGSYRAFHGYVEQVTEYVEKHSYGESVLAFCRDNQSKALLNLGQYREALVRGQEAYDLYLSICGADHPDTLHSLNNLAIAHSKMGDWQRAMDLTRTAYDANLRLHGSDHEGTVSCLNNMAIYSVMLGDYEGAAELMEDSHRSMRHLLGAEHPKTIICQNNLAAVYNRLGEYRKATELLKQVYDTQLRTLGADHPDILFTLFNLSIGHSKLGEHETALTLAEKAYEAHVRILGTGHPDTISALNNLAECHLNLGSRDTARRMAEQAWEERCRLLGEEHPDTKESHSLLQMCS